MPLVVRKPLLSSVSAEVRSTSGGSMASGISIELSSGISSTSARMDGGKAGGAGGLA